MHSMARKKTSSSYTHRRPVAPYRRLDWFRMVVELTWAAVTSWRPWQPIREQSIRVRPVCSGQRPAKSMRGRAWCAG